MGNVILSFLCSFIEKHSLMNPLKTTILRSFIAMILFVMMISSPLKGQDSLSVIMNIAFEQAQRDNKNIFIKFGASWCGWCIVLDKKIKSDSLLPLFEEHYVIVDLVANEILDEHKHLENPGATDLLLQYMDNDRLGLPFWLIFDKNGNYLTDAYDEKRENISCPVKPHEIEVFIEKLRSTSKLTSRELAIIEREFARGK